LQPLQIPRVGDPEAAFGLIYGIEVDAELLVEVVY
jgi:hypothetical protein